MWISRIGVLASFPLVLSACYATNNQKVEITTSSTGMEPLVAGYAGQPYARVIPGIIECEQYDLGGEGVAYHDIEATNEGTGCCDNALRPNEGPDINMIKDHDHTVDGSEPLHGARYLGWIREGEWIKYTVDVPIEGNFAINSHMTCGGPGNQMEILSNDVPLTKTPLELPSTGDVHTWMIAENLATVHLPAGRQVLTLRMVQGGNWNLDYLEFVSVDESKH